MLKSTAVRDSINKDVLLEFHQWLQEGDSRSSGHHGILDSIETAYIPYKKLVLYFDQHRVKRMLEALFPEGYDAHLPREILANYTRVFSILLESGKGRFITYFVRHADLSDENLPFDSRPPAFPLSTDQNMLRNFQDCQWVFCAHLFDFDCNVTLNANCILPIIEKERVGRNNTTIRHKILLDGEYNKLLPFNDDLIVGRLGFR